MSDVGPQRQSFWGNHMEEKKTGGPKLRWLACTEKGLKLMGVKRWRKKEEDRSVW